MQSGVDHLGHWTLTALLPALPRTAGTRTVTMTSTAHHRAAPSTRPTPTLRTATARGAPTARPSSPTTTSDWDFSARSPIQTPPRSPIPTIAGADRGQAACSYIVTLGVNATHLPPTACGTRGQLVASNGLVGCPWPWMVLRSCCRRRGQRTAIRCVTGGQYRSPSARLFRDAGACRCGPAARWPGRR
jgi:hypothetical protein